MRVLSLLALLVAAQDRVPVRLVGLYRDGRAVLVVRPDAGVRLNARAAPVLELADGRHVLLGHGPVTIDSAYFTGEAWAARPSYDAMQGTLRVAYCLASERFCRTATLPVDLPREPGAASRRR